MGAMKDLLIKLENGYPLTKDERTFVEHAPKNDYYLELLIKSDQKGGDTDGRS